MPPLKHMRTRDARAPRALGIARQPEIFNLHQVGALLAQKAVHSAVHLVALQVGEKKRGVGKAIQPPRRRRPEQQDLAAELFQTRLCLAAELVRTESDKVNVKRIAQRPNIAVDAATGSVVNRVGRYRRDDEYSRLHLTGWMRRTPDKLDPSVVLEC